MQGSNPLLLREQVGVMSSLLTVGCHTRSRVYGAMVSQPLPSISVWVFFFSILLLCKCCSVIFGGFFCFAEEIFHI